MKDGKKSTGGKRNAARSTTKKLAWKGGNFSATKISEEEERKTVSGKGKHTEKTKQFKAKFASVVDKKTKKTVNAEILTVLENSANRHYVRGNIITKGAVIKVKFGSDEKKARVTSRPGQIGTIEAVLIE